MTETERPPAEKASGDPAKAPDVEGAARALCEALGVALDSPDRETVEGLCRVTVLGLHLALRRWCREGRLSA